MGRLEGKACVITGAGSGIGRACALRLAQEGARVAVADVAEAPGRATAEAIAAAGGDAVFLPVDVTDESSVEALYARAVDALGAVHVLVNNAGILHPDDDSVVSTSLETWHQVVAINLTGVFLCCKHGIPAVLASGGGSVINMASISGLVGSATSQIAYAATKGGVIALSRDIAVEYARQGIRCNAVCPGPVETPLAMQLFTDDAEWQRRRIHIPTGHLGRPEDVANAVLFLAGEESGWVTGSCLVVDGGISIAYTTPQD